MRSIALGLDLKETFFDDKIDQKYHNLRILSYPPIKTEILRQEGQARAGAHSGEVVFSLVSAVIHSHMILDYGTLTLLFQDSVSI